MDRATVKLLLEGFRPQDAADPMFAEALAEVARDPELAAWFETVQRLDASISASLREAVPVSAALKAHILVGLQTETPARSSLFWKYLSAIAAAVLLAAFLGWKMLVPSQPAEALALQAVNFTNEMPPLQFVCFDATAVAAWVNEQPRARQAGIELPKPGKAADMAMIGSSVVDWNGKPVVMICLQNSKRMAMLYILNAEDGKAWKEGARETFQKDGWVVRTSLENGQVRLLTTKGQPEDLDFTTPF